MADLNGFDANQVEPTGDFEPIPAGKYLAVITDSEMKPNKAGTGSLLSASGMLSATVAVSGALLTGRVCLLSAPSSGRGAGRPEPRQTSRRQSRSD